MNQENSILENNQRRTITVQQSLFGKNREEANQNRCQFSELNLPVLNLLSSPGSGKTQLLERTLEHFHGIRRLGVIVGDLQTENDAERLRRHGSDVVSITTGTVCHLEATMLANAVKHLPLADLDLLFVENVGNLVCPASFDLGENARVVLLSTTEGEDKPLKYPKAFKSADVVVLNKIDLSEVLGFDRDAALRNIQQISPNAKILEVSARTGEGMDSWYHYLEAWCRGFNNAMCENGEQSISANQ